jgi:hypothetical protein
VLPTASYVHPRAGSGGLSVANQIYDRFKAAGKPLNPGDVAIIDPAENHYYQVRLRPWRFVLSLTSVLSPDGERSRITSSYARLISWQDSRWCRPRTKVQVCSALSVSCAKPHNPHCGPSADLFPKVFFSHDCLGSRAVLRLPRRCSRFENQLGWHPGPPPSPHESNLRRLVHLFLRDVQ